MTGTDFFLFLRFRIGIFPILSFLLFTFSSPGYPGPAEILWEVEISSEFDSCLWGIDFTDDGGAICVGEAGSEDKEITSLLLTKLTPQGSVQWESITGWGLATSGQDVIQIPGGYAVCGSIFSGTDYDGFIARFDYFGNVLWCNQFYNIDNDVLFDIALTDSGSFVAAGYTESTGAGEKDFWLVLVDDSGNMQWSKAFGTSKSEIAYSVTTLENGGFALGGGSDGDFYIVITDEEGIGQSAMSFDNGGHETARCLIESSEGGFFFAGSTMKQGDYQADVWLVRVSASGHEIWSLTIEGDDNDSAWDAVEPVTGGFIVLANTMSFGRESYDAILYRIDPWGNIIWEMNAGNIHWNTGSGLSINQEGNLLFTGRTWNNDTGCFVPWIVYTSPEDLLNWP